MKNRKFIGTLSEQNVRTRSKPLIMEMDSYVSTRSYFTQLFCCAIVVRSLDIPSPHIVVDLGLQIADFLESRENVGDLF